MTARGLLGYEARHAECCEKVNEPMLISAFTPLSASGNPYIEEAYQSLVSQTHPNWEWIVLENNGGKLPPRVAADPRVFVESGQGGTIVGSLKREAAEMCTGEWIVELDHDDALSPRALAMVASRDSIADFLFSDFAEFHSDSGAPNPYAATYGWDSYSVEFRGKWLLAMKAPENPIDWRRILWAPNHLRAWRRSTYVAAGGHDRSLEFADDQDLVLRTFLSGARCRRIPECLYFYRVHDKQNVKLNNGRIQELAGGVYDRYVYQLAEKAARDQGLHLIDLCGAHGCPTHYTPIDCVMAFGRSDPIVCDLNQKWKLEDNSVGVLRAFDAIEHLKDPIHTMNEAWRVLAPGGVMLIMVPSTDGKGAWCDPTHVSFWNDLSFRYYTDDQFRKYVPAVKARFQVSGLRNIEGAIPYVKAELIALKDGYRPMGETLC